MAQPPPVDRSVLVDSGAGGLAVVSVDPLEAAQFAPIATTRAKTHDDAEVTQALAKLCLPGGQYDEQPRRGGVDDRVARPVRPAVPAHAAAVPVDEPPVGLAGGPQPPGVRKTTRPPARPQKTRPGP